MSETANSNPEKLPNLLKFEPFSPHELYLEWSNGEKFRVPYEELRYQCPCAHCVDEHTGRRMIKREQVSKDIKVKGAHPIGRYALQIQFSDGHGTGIFPFESLYEIGVTNGLRFDS
ncbi:MAG: DUF971 domain-containing protein [Proteobacteria bacterium]|nr:MAG: DUF971 domain-containing protein [Pseudomonadota bacterium]